MAQSIEQIPNEIVLEAFQDSNHLDWKVVNDGVMGGLSESTLEMSEDNTGIFSGYVSLENNGGFASVRALLTESPEGINRLAVRVKGDGKKYQLRLRTNANFDGPAYVMEFVTKAGEWELHELPLNGFYAQFRGYRLYNAPELKAEDIRQIGFLVGDKQEGEFQLEIDYVKGLR